MRMYPVNTQSSDIHLNTCLLIFRFMGRCVVDQPINEVVKFLDDHERRKEWDKYLAVWHNI